ncbi:disulfide bond formation protein B [Methyloceanibacter sp.]|uniref:disulfide bond formation protein B n=1 Tax=Methyloceanibacter sp. TaxID=1965321 RepID=UPI002D3C6277|nr:disulfide bond formation protein B [Methyloceanibacter sp.]HZP10641.1 disulfide bond formation protein B [Methyloceanibacter sp.]
MDATGRPIIAKPPRNVLHAAALVLVVALATILTALGFEHLGGYVPCPLCLEERYAYYFAIPVAALAVLLVRGENPGAARILLAAIALAFLANVGLAVFHAGVEWKWWPGPTECTGAFDLQWGQGGVVDTPVIRCDEASFRFLGLSFAGWDALVSVFLAGAALWGAAHRR